MTVINRNFIHKDIQYFDGYPELNLKTHKDFVDEITFWKTVLYEEYGLRPGNIIALNDGSIRFSYCTLFFAAAELGLRMIITPEYPLDPSGRTERMDRFVEKYGKISLSIFDEISGSKPLLLAMGKRYSEQCGFKKIFHEYTIKDSSVYDLMRNTVFANPDDVMTITSTSGSSGVPKFIEYTHKQIYTTAKRMVSVFDYNTDSHVCHLRNMHHPFVLLDYFMPVMHASVYHYSMALNYGQSSDEEMTTFINFINNQKISKLIFSARAMIDQMFSYMINKGLTFGHEIDLIVGGQYTTVDFIEKMQKTNVTRISAGFGSSETVGVLLRKYLYPDTDVTTYDEKYVGKPIDDFYKFTLTDESLYVSCPELFDGTKRLDDRFSGNDADGYYHLGRSNFYRIDHIEFRMDDITSVVDRNFNGEYDICVDAINQKMYLCVWNGDLDFTSVDNALYDSVGIRFTGWGRLNKDEFNQAVKLDQELIRTYFRNKQ
jgi:hypothetical protein